MRSCEGERKIQLFDIAYAMGSVIRFSIRNAEPSLALGDVDRWARV